MVNLKEDVMSYEKKASSKMFQHAETVIPGGVTANIKHFAPYPIFMKKRKRK